MFNFTAQFHAIKSSIIGLVLILATAVIGLGWIGIGLCAVFVHYLGAMWGPIALGGLFLLPIIIYGIIKSLPGAHRQRKQTAFEQAFANSTVGSMSILIDSLQAKSPVLAAVAAILAGFVATRFPQFLPILSQVVSAAVQEVQLYNVKRAEAKVRRSRETEASCATPPPPDVEPVRRRKKTADMY